MFNSIIKILLSFMFILTFVSCAQSTLKPSIKANLQGTMHVFSEDVADYNSNTGVGCIVNKNPNNLNQAHIVCKSKHSAEYAWNAVTARSKEMCTSSKWTMLFKRSPSLPKQNGIYGAQMDIVCKK